MVVAFDCRLKRRLRIYEFAILRNATLAGGMPNFLLAGSLTFSKLLAFEHRQGAGDFKSTLVVRTHLGNLGAGQSTIAGT